MADELERWVTEAFEVLVDLEGPTGKSALDAVRDALADATFSDTTAWHFVVDEANATAWDAAAAEEGFDDRAASHNYLAMDGDAALYELEIGLADEEDPDEDGVYAWRVRLVFQRDEDEPWTREVFTEQGAAAQVFTAFEPGDELGEAFEPLAERPVVAIRREPFTPF